MDRGANWRIRKKHLPRPRISSRARRSSRINCPGNSKPSALIHGVYGAVHEVFFAFVWTQLIRAPTHVHRAVPDTDCVILSWSRRHFFFSYISSRRLTVHNLGHSDEPRGDLFANCDRPELVVAYSISKFIQSRLIDPPQSAGTLREKKGF